MGVHFEDSSSLAMSETSATSAGGKVKAQKQKGELDEQLRDYINEWRKQREKEEEELLRLKEETEKKAKEAEEKKKRLEEAEMKRQEMMQAQKRKATSRRQGRRSQSIRRRKCSRRKERNDQNQRAIGGREKDLPFHQNQTPRCR